MTLALRDQSVPVFNNVGQLIGVRHPKRTVTELALDTAAQLASDPKIRELAVNAAETAANSIYNSVQNLGNQAVEFITGRGKKKTRVDFPITSRQTSIRHPSQRSQQRLHLAKLGKGSSLRNNLLKKLRQEKRDCESKLRACKRDLNSIQGKRRRHAKKRI